MESAGGDAVRLRVGPMKDLGFRRALVALVAIGIAGCAGSDTQGAAPEATTTTTTSFAPPVTDRAPGNGECGTSSTPAPVYDHVIWIFMENRRYDEVIGNPAAPFETGLARHC